MLCFSNSLAHSDSEVVSTRASRRHSARNGRREKRRSRKSPVHATAPLSAPSTQRAASPVSDLLLTFDEIQSGTYISTLQPPRHATNR